MKKIEILLVSAAALVFGTFAHAGDVRVWTTRKLTLEGELLKADMATVTIVDKAGKQTPFKMEDMSIADREYIVRYNQGDPKILALGVPGEPEKEYRLDEKSFVKNKDEKLVLGAASLETLKSEHFVVATSGEVRANVIAEAAERIWYGMAFEHMDFRKDWGDRRLLIIVDNDRKSHAAVAKWYPEYLKGTGRADEAGRESISINEDDIMMGIEIPSDIAEKIGVRQDATYFNAVHNEGLKKAFSPGLIHSMAGLVMGKLIGGFAPSGGQGGEIMMDGHNYFKEYTLTGEIATGKAGVGGGPDSQKAQHMEINRENWPKAIKTAVKKGSLTLDLNAIGMKREGMDQNTLYLGFALSYYLQSSNLRLAYYSALVQRMSTGHAVPVAEEFAKIYGFSSVDAFNADWKAFIESPAFK